jgi:hypothetical protein
MRTARVLKNHGNAHCPQFLREMLKEQLKTVSRHIRKLEEMSTTSGRLDSGREPAGCVAIIHDPGRTHSFRAAAAMKLVLEAKAPFIQSNHPRYALLLDKRSEVFFNASCCSWLVFRCRLRPVCQLILRWLNNQLRALTLL